MPQQLTFDLPVREALGREDFFVSSANAVALATLDGWQDWPQGKMALIGARGAGKTHLAHVWAAEAGASIVSAADLTEAEAPALAAGAARVVVEDADAIAGDREAEVALFHLHNLVLASGGRLLLTAATAPNRWPLGLPDLASRMQATAVAALEPPDDALLSAVLLKLFADRQIAVAPNLIPYLAARIDRSFAAARDAVAQLDQQALAQSRPVTRALAAEVLDLGAEDAP
ncbi:chromosomal replication initiator DnaA [Acidimangrovimonas pyrenivorans]|uniref:Chromosomal replication initiator DnaA n=1 Tax=Acidimangrovimonas pyrenivorans TaxID=2030798 RepID=A0ABV7AC26_9RHOB